MRLTGSVVVVMFLATATARAQIPGMPGRDAPTSKTGTAQLSGRVISLESGRPLRRATVRAFGSELREGRSATTDADGRWTLKGLPAGKYAVSVTKGGHAGLIGVKVSVGVRRARDPLRY